MDVLTDSVPIDIRKQTTESAFEKVKNALIELGFEEDII